MHGLLLLYMFERSALATAPLQKAASCTACTSHGRRPRLCAGQHGSKHVCRTAWQQACVQDSMAASMCAGQHGSKHAQVCSNTLAHTMAGKQCSPKHMHASKVSRKRRALLHCSSKATGLQHGMVCCTLAGQSEPASHAARVIVLIHPQGEHRAIQRPIWPQSRSQC
jgi:hypothetical protein